MPVKSHDTTPFCLSGRGQTCVCKREPLSQGSAPATATGQTQPNTSFGLFGSLNSNTSGGGFGQPSGSGFFGSGQPTTPQGSFSSVVSSTPFGSGTTPIFGSSNQQGAGQPSSGSFQFPPMNAATSTYQQFPGQPFQQFQSGFTPQPNPYQQYSGQPFQQFSGFPSGTPFQQFQPQSFQPFSSFGTPAPLQPQHNQGFQAQPFFQNAQPQQPFQNQQLQPQYQQQQPFNPPQNPMTVSSAEVQPSHLHRGGSHGRQQYANNSGFGREYWKVDLVTPSSKITIPLSELFPGFASPPYLVSEVSTPAASPNPRTYRGSSSDSDDNGSIISPPSVHSVSSTSSRRVVGVAPNPSTN